LSADCGFVAPFPTFLPRGALRAVLLDPANAGDLLLLFLVLFLPD